jgi:hypothetical protein
MTLDLTDEETAALLRELDDRYFMSQHQDPESDPLQDQAGAGVRTFAAAAEALRTAAGNSEAETARGALRAMIWEPGPPMTLGVAAYRT